MFENSHDSNFDHQWKQIVNMSFILQKLTSISTFVRESVRYFTPGQMDLRRYKPVIKVLHRGKLVAEQRRGKS